MDLSELLGRWQARENDPLHTRTYFMQLKPGLPEKCNQAAEYERGIDNLIRGSWACCRSLTASGLSMIVQGGFDLRLRYLMLATRQVKANMGKSALHASSKTLPASH